MQQPGCLFHVHFKTNEIQNTSQGVQLYTIFMHKYKRKSIIVFRCMEHSFYVCFKFVCLMSFIIALNIPEPRN